MHWAKVIVLLLLVLAVMRAISWSLSWLLRKAAPHKKALIAVIANAAGFGMFAGWLYWGLLPGEPVDVEGLFFGLAVFAVYCAIDLRWARRAQA